MTRILGDRSGWKPVHTRKIDIQTFDLGAGAIVVEGTLKDDRLHATYPMTGEQRPPGTVHHMTVRMRVTGPAMTIDAIDVELPAVPRDGCPEAASSLESIVGLRITAGFTGRVKARVGGARGCTHLVALLLAMAPAAVQGFWAAVSTEPVDPSVYGEKALALLTDTCRVWRRNGPLMTEYREKIGRGLETD
jgi:Protein of unknown function (DUF2889)